MNIPWARYSLDLKGYQDLLQQLQSDEPLWGFVEHKLWYKELLLYYICPILYS